MKFNVQFYHLILVLNSISGSVLFFLLFSENFLKIIYNKESSPQLNNDNCSYGYGLYFSQ